ncbi:MAG TPA: NADH-quinone oxidoreductase subunit J [Nitrolancea sp.]|nr:NADH-quinone oxidoreductase subunit J [Nitrolancea sp.]
MSVQVVVFDILGLIAVISALGVVLAKRPVHSAIALALSFINVAGIYVMLRAEFLAAIQIIVYAGAILVLVLFVLMLVQEERLPEFYGGRPVQRAVGFILGLILLGEVAAAILARNISGQMGPWTTQAVQSVGGNVQALGQVLYAQNVLPIQAVALVLLVATIGALVLARPDVVEVRTGATRGIFSISLGHPRGSDDVEPETVPALEPGTTLFKSEAGDRELVMARDGEEFTEQPAWGERER